MAETKICPFMSNGEDHVDCLREKCQLWFVETQGIDSSLNPANCAVAHVPLLALEISNNTRLMRDSMVESIAL